VGLVYDTFDAFRWRDGDPPDADAEYEPPETVDALDAATRYMLHALRDAPDDALAGASPYLRLFALARGGVSLAGAALNAERAGGPAAADWAVARFFAENIAIAAPGLSASVCEGAASVNAFEGSPA